jgi:PAS domain S-box-containing protein
VVLSDVVVEVWDSAPGSDAAAVLKGKRLGFLVVRRILLSGPGADVIGRLVGTGATVAIGNRAGDLWTDFAGQVMHMSVDAARPGISSRQGDAGGERVGGLSVIDLTPWSLWVEFPSNLILLPARAFIIRLAVLAMGFVLAAAALVTVVSARITKPLIDLTQASEAIAAGEYSTQVRTDRRDEIGRLGVAFTTMSEQVAKAHRTLEERVSRRTATLEETRALLEQRLEELQKARAELDRFFALSPDMLCIADMNGRFLRVNAAWQDELGWSPDELTSRPYVEFIHPDDRQPTNSETAQLAGGHATQRFENRYRCKDGSYRWLSWKATPILEHGVIYASARDVTERRRLARELESRATELTTLNQELEAFSYSVSHDLRAPLRHVTGFVALLERSAAAKLDAEELRRLQTISEAATRMGRLIDDLLAFSRMGRTALAKRRINLDEMVRDARRELSADPASTQAKWVVHPLPEIDGDPAMLRLVFVNLIANALKYSRKKTEPRIEIGPNGGSADETVVFVRDNGVGFDMQYVDKLFGVFQRLHRADEFEGTGIGLANVRRIVHRHGGRVWAEGRIDGGATFYFSLPRA